MANALARLTNPAPSRDCPAAFLPHGHLCYVTVVDSCRSEPM